MTTAIACETIKDEILYVSSKVDCHFPFIWLPSALHKFPDKLRYQLQSEIDQLIDEENILAKGMYWISFSINGFPLI